MTNGRKEQLIDSVEAYAKAAEREAYDKVLTMTAEEYYEKLKEAQRTLDSAQDDLDRAIEKHQRRIETGYEYLEDVSRRAVCGGLELVKLAVDKLNEAATAKIEY